MSFASRKIIVGLIVLGHVLSLAACAQPYAYKPVPFKDVAFYENHTSVFGATVGAEAFYDRGRLKDVFGFDMRKAGVVPVQVAIENTGSKPVSILYGAMLLDDEGQWWELLPSNVVYDRIAQHTSGGVDAEGTVKRTFLFGLAGAVVGAAVGAVGGTNVGEAIGKGAAVGGALGASTGIMGMDTDNQSSRGDVARDFADRDMNSRLVEPGTSDHGFLYFPSEMGRPKTLRLYFSSGDASARKSAESRQIDLPL